MKWNPYRKFVCIVLLTTFIVTVRLDAAQPLVACGILPNDAIETTELLQRVSNVQKLAIQVIVSSSDRRTLPKISIDDPSNGVNGNVRIEVVARESGSPVRTRISLASIGQIGQMQRATALLEMPIAASAAAATVASYADTLTQTIRAENADDETILQIVDGNRLALLKLLESMFVENVPGVYEMACRYREQVAAPFGPVTGRPLTIEVVDQGRFFDQPRFRLRQ